MKKFLWRVKDRVSGGMHVLRMIVDIFPRNERWPLANALGVSCMAAFFETVGVASILPFMALVIDPSLLDHSTTLQSAARSLGVQTPRGELILAGGLTVIIIALGNLTGALNIIIQQRFGAKIIARLSARLFEGYLRQPYSFHVQRDAPSLIKVVLNDVSTVVNGVTTQILLGVSKSLMIIGIVVVLFLQDPFLALTAAAALSIAFCGMFLLGRIGQHKLGVRYNQDNLTRQRVAQEAFGGIKELQVLGRETHAINLFAGAVEGSARSAASSNIWGQVPRYVLETLAFGGTLALTLILVAGGSAAQSVIPVLSLYAFAGYRLLPALNQVFFTAMSLKFTLPTFLELHSDLQVVSQSSTRPVEPNSQFPEDLCFKESLRFERVTFNYEGAPAPALKDVDLFIRPYESIGLVGRTGAGKTTIADLMLGLYEPSTGRVTVDGVPLSPSTIPIWHRAVGYVPQQVFLANASVSENIAFGLAPQKIDLDAVRLAARLAQADEFVCALPQGFDTVVGERGVKLSGGQRQRIGIARALYHKPKLLVFDEATSALDGLTEDAVMEAVRALHRQVTVVVIAHRLRTVEACDRVVLIEGGRIVADGKYDELLDRSADFRRLVGQKSAAFTGIES